MFSKNSTLLLILSFVLVLVSIAGCAPSSPARVEQAMTLQPSENLNGSGSPVEETATVLPQPAPTNTEAVPSQGSDGIAPYPGAPECPSHDPTTWHGLWDSVSGCHYDHEHGDDPSVGNADKYFGPPGALWGGQTIAYPFTSSDHENMDAPTGKHAGFKYIIRTPEYHPFPPCGEFDQNDLKGDDSDNCVMAIRAELHALGSLMDLATRYHSGFVEYYVCKKDMSTCGTFQTGGLIDWGALQAPQYSTRRVRPRTAYTAPTFTIDFGSSIGNGISMTYTSDSQYPDLPTQSGEPYLFSQLYNDDNLTFFRETNLGQPFAMDSWSSNDFDCEPRPEGDPCHNAYYHILYLVGDSWTLIDPVDLRNVHFLCEEGKPCYYNGTLSGVNEAGVNVLSEWDMLDGVQDGLVTWSGYSDKFGNPRFDDTCTAVSRDCIPMVMGNLPVGVAMVRTSDGCACETFEHDIYFDGQPSGWVKFPN